MPFIPVFGTIQVNVKGTIHGQTVENVLYFKKQTGNWTQADASLFVEDLNTVYDQKALPFLSSDYTLTEFYTVDLSGANSWYFPFSVGQPGGDPNDALPSTDAIVTTLITPNRGRSFRGRSYQAGFPKSNVLNSVLIGAVQAAWVIFWNNIALTASNYDAWHVVVSRVENGVPRINGVATPITDYRVNTVVANQRRRRVGSGS